MGIQILGSQKKLHVYLIIIDYTIYILFKYDWIEDLKYTFNKAIFS